MTTPANGVAYAPEWLIRPERLRRIAGGAAGRNIQIARLLGETPTIDTDWLEGLYYRQRGRCAISGIKMTDPQENKLFSIELDHIVPIKKNQRVQAAVHGVVKDGIGGGVASRNNVRWVCRAAHNVRHNIEHYGIDLIDFCQRVCSIIENGCEIDLATSENINGDKAFADSARIAICELTCNGTKYASFNDLYVRLDARGIKISQANARAAMVDVVGNVKTFARRLRLEALRRALVNDASFRDLILNEDFLTHGFERCNQYLSTQGIPAVSSTVLYQDFKTVGVSLRRKRGYGKSRRNRSAVAGDVRSRLWGWGKAKGPGGFTFSEAREFLRTNETHLSLALSDGVSRRLLDRESETFIGRLNRKEAAKFVALSPQVLKKYAVLGKGPPYEMAKPGIGVETTYSFSDLIHWRQINPQRESKTQSNLSFA